MKHAFIFGTNIYLSSRNTVSYARAGKQTEFLTISSSFEPDKQGNEGRLSIDAEFRLTNNDPVKVIGNKIETGTGVYIETELNRVRVFRTGHQVPVLDVFQLAGHEHHSFGTMITGEIDAQQPDHVITIKGDINVDGGTIWIDNEKLHVDDEIFASGVTNDHDGVILSADKFAY